MKEKYFRPVTVNAETLEVSDIEKSAAFPFVAALVGAAAGGYAVGKAVGSAMKGNIFKGTPALRKAH